MEELIYKYFPNLTQIQKEQIKAIGPLYREWNKKINIVSRNDIDNLYLRHVLHSLAIAAFIKFPSKSSILDVGTGGGFPGIPLSILFPKSKFYLCDSIKKKIEVVNEISSALNLTNVATKQIRAEQIERKFDYVLSRGVTHLSKFIPWVWNKIEPSTSTMERGIIYLKGGNLEEEIMEACKANRIKRGNVYRYPIKNWFVEEWFNEKEVLFIKKG